MGFVGFETAAIIGVIGFCTLWIVLVLQDIGRRAAGQRAMLHQQLLEIVQNQERQETLLSLIEASTSRPGRDEVFD